MTPPLFPIVAGVPIAADQPCCGPPKHKPNQP